VHQQRWAAGQADQVRRRRVRPAAELVQIATRTEIRSVSGEDYPELVIDRGDRECLTQRASA